MPSRIYSLFGEKVVSALNLIGEIWTEKVVEWRRAVPANLLASNAWKPFFSQS